MTQMEVLFDTHAHLDFPDFDPDREAVIQRANDDGVRYIVAIGSGSGLDCQERAIAIAQAHEGVWATVGAHPHSAKLVRDDTLAWLKGLAGRDKVVAIGEIGLDYVKTHSPVPIQLQRFRDQLGLARELDLPVVIHDREAHDDTVRVLKEDGLPRAGGIMHCFSGGLALALELIGLGMYISIPGPITYKNARELPAVVAGVPLDRLLLETDSPFLSPHPHRGQRNEPARVKLVAQAIAKLRGLALDEVAHATTQNAFHAFHLE